MGIIAAVLMICAVVSTSASRAEGAAAVRPYARLAGIIAIALWLAIILLPHPKG